MSIKRNNWSIKTDVNSLFYLNEYVVTKKRKKQIFISRYIDI